MELISAFLETGKSVMNLEIVPDEEVSRYDIGNRLDYAKTFVEFALKRSDIGPDLRRHLEQIFGDEGKSRW